MKRILLLLAALLFAGSALAAVNINTATKEELDALPGIGPVKSQAILDYRNANGPFKTPEDIMKVKGIGAKRYERLKAELTVSPLRPGTPKADGHGPAAKGDIKATADARARK